MSAESFTILAILEARDQASEVFAKLDETLDKFGTTAASAADTVKGAGAEIDESLLQTASGADALNLADAKVAAASAQLAAALREQAAAETELLDAQRTATDGAGAEAGADDALVAASQRLATAQREATTAASQLAAAQKTQSDTAEAAAAKTDTAAASATTAGSAGEAAAGGIGAMAKTAGIVAVGMGVAGAVMVKAAGNFQDSTTHLVTDAGESAKNLGMVQAGILQVSTATGQSATDITNAMYHIESGGYHGAAGLNLLKVAAEGARVGGADLDTVSKTLVGTMNAYGMSSSQAASFMNQLITTVGQGDMKMQDLASSLSSVAPLAASLHVSFAQVGGAIATMTAQGMSANRASQDLANTLRSLSNPNNVAIAEMNQLGINAQDVSQNLGKKGLTGTISELTTAITSHMGASGKVIMNAFTQSTTAGNDLTQMMKNLPPQLQTLGKQFEAGSINAQQWRNDLLQQTPVNQKLMTQFATLYEKSKSFNSLLAAGGPAAQTYTAALAKMMGGATGLNTALMISGGRQQTFDDNVKKISASAKTAGGDVDNWSTIQGTFNFKMESAKTAVENTGIAIGSALLPAATDLLKAVTAVVEPIAEWTAKHKTLTEILFVTVTAIAAVVAVVGVATKVYKAITGTIENVGKAIQKVTGLFKSGADAQAAAAEESATAQETASGEASAAMEADAAETAAAEETAATESSASWIAAAASSVAGWAVSGVKMVAQAAVWVAQNIAKVAVVVASNLAGAATTAAAWLAANAVMTAGIILVVAAVAAGVYEIVKHWHDIVSGVEDAWNTVYGFISGIVTTIVNFVKSHWQLLIGVVTGPLGIIVAEIATHWHTIESWFTDGVHDVESILNWFAGLPGMFLRWLDSAASSVTSGGSRILSWFEGLPGRILGYVRNFGSLLINAGEQIVEGLLRGIENAAGGLLGEVENLASEVSSAFSSVLSIFSPSKVFASHGANIVAGLVQGLQANTGKAVTAAANMARQVMNTMSGSAASAGTIGATMSGAMVPALGAAGAGGGTVINLNVTGNTVMSNSDVDNLVNKIGKRLATVTLPSAGRATKAF